MVGAVRDRVVPVRAQKLICRRLPNCYFKLISNSYHEILKEKDSIRAEFWMAFDKFTGKNS
jgi:alpha-beta hydrolase superfamily lysophospholipase